MLAILSALIPFLTGAVGRALIGRGIAWLEQKQADRRELALLEAQEKIVQAAHLRQLETIKLQHQLGVEQIHVQSDADVSKLEADAFKEAMKVANQPTGIRWVDAWNGVIRPSTATIAIALWLLSVLKAALVITEWDRNLIASVLGYYFADRHIGKAK